MYRKHGEHVLPDSGANDMDNDTDLNNDNDMDNMDNDLQPEARADIPPSMDELLRHFKANL